MYEIWKLHKTAAQALNIQHANAESDSYNGGNDAKLFRDTMSKSWHALDWFAEVGNMSIHSLP